MADKSDSEIESERTLAILKDILMNQVVIMDAMRGIRHFPPLSARVYHTEEVIRRIGDAEADTVRKQQERASAPRTSQVICRACNGTGRERNGFECTICAGTGRLL